MKAILAGLLFFGITHSGVAQIFNFEEISVPAGVNNKGVNSGVAFSDFDNDGDDDVYVSIRDGINILYRNNGNNSFTDISEEAGLADLSDTRTSVWGDINNDGLADLYVGNWRSADALYLNNGDGTFTDITSAAGISNVGQPLSVNMVDIDNDGLLDIYVSNFAAHNVMLRNNGDNTFTDVTVSSGALDQGANMGAVFFDYDMDGDQDLYLTHDSHVANILYRNEGDGSFTNVSAQAGVDYVGFGMGVDVGDVNNDGWLDMYVSNLYDNILFINNGDGTFEDISQECGANDYGMSWGTNFLDFDNDGLLDVYVSNDSYYSPYPNALFRNLGNNQFEQVDIGQAVSSELGGYGSAVGDVDGDGFVDIMVANTDFFTTGELNDFNQLFRNTNSSGNWIQFKLVGTSSNRDAVGAMITISYGNKVMVDQVLAGSGFASQNSLVQHFGIGGSGSVREVKVRWPGGEEQVFYDLEPNQKYVLTEGEDFNLILGEEEFDRNVPEFNIFPNPLGANSVVEFTTMQSSVASLSVTDLSGRGIISFMNNSQLPAGNHRFALGDLRSTLNPGIYLLQLSTSSASITRKIILR